MNGLKGRLIFHGYRKVDIAGRVFIAEGSYKAKISLYQLHFISTYLLLLQLQTVSEDSILANLILSCPSRMMNLLAFRSLKPKKNIGKILVKTF